jgi:hypothetical protein
LRGTTAIWEKRHVLHLGAGTVYYKAIMAHLVGSTFEYGSSVPALAHSNLASLQIVQVVQAKRCDERQTADMQAAAVESKYDVYLFRQPRKCEGAVCFDVMGITTWARCSTSAFLVS